MSNKQIDESLEIESIEMEKDVEPFQIDPNHSLNEEEIESIQKFTHFASDEDLSVDEKVTITLTLESRKSYIDFLVRLNYDGLYRNNFFNGLIEGYLEKEESAMKFLEYIKEKYSKQSEKNKERVQKAYLKEQKLRAKFGIEESDINSIFDIIDTDEELF